MIDGRRKRRPGVPGVDPDMPGVEHGAPGGTGVEHDTPGVERGAPGVTGVESVAFRPTLTEEDRVPMTEAVDPGTGEPSGRRPRLRLNIGGRLARLGVKADHVTVVGVLIAGATGAVIALGHLWIGVALVTVGGLMDTLDGAVAKAAGSASKRGAFFDSVTDRVADGLIFGGLAWYFAAGPGKDPGLALLPFGIIAVSNLISYERAKAESLGWVAKGGLMERAERLILLGVALLFNVVLVPLLWALFALCVFTAGQRFVRVWRQASADWTGTAAKVRTWGPARVESRWREWRAASSAAKRPRVATRARLRARRREEPLSTRVRRMLAPETAGAGRRGRVASDASDASGARSAGGVRGARAGRRRQSRAPREGAAASLRRHLGPTR